MNTVYRVANKVNKARMTGRARVTGIVRMVRIRSRYGQGYGYV